MRTEREIIAYYDGMCEGVMLYAWWRDGVQYVGTTGRTLQQALTALDAERDKALDDIRYYNG